MAIDLFETRTMLEAVEQMLPPKSFLLDTFFALVDTVPTEIVDIDIVKGHRKMAPFVSPRLAGKLVTDQGYTTRTFRPPYLKPKKVTEAAKLLIRSPGEALYSGRSPTERAAEKLGRDLRELDEMCTRREEWMAAQALTTGEVDVVGEGVDVTIDFALEATHNVTLTDTALWTDAASDPLGKLREFRRVIVQDSGLSADVLVLGSSVVNTFLAHELVRDQLNIRRFELGIIQPQNLPNGVTYLGYLADPGVDVYAYDEWFVDDAGDTQPMIPVDRIVMGSTRAATRRAYGAIQDVEAMEGGLVEARRYPKSWTEKDPSVRFVMLQSAALPIPSQIDAFLTAKVI